MNKLKTIMEACVTRQERLMLETSNLVWRYLPIK